MPSSTSRSQLRPTVVGPTPEQLGGYTDGDLFGRGRDLALAAQDPDELTRWYTEQDREGVLRLSALDREEGDRRLGLRVERRCLLYIQLAHGAGAESHLGNFQRTLL
jgi:PAS domain-containing protein